MSSAPLPAAALVYIPDTASTRQYIGAWSVLSVLQYFAAESAVIGAWAGPEPYDRSTGLISDLGAVTCGIFDGRAVCSPLHLLMNASFFVQGLGILLGALLLSSGLLRVAARAGARARQGEKPWRAALVVRIFMATAGAGTMLVGLVPEDVGSPLHFAGALMFFTAGALGLTTLGAMWLRKTPLGWFILGCGVVSLSALVAGGLTRMDVPEPGTLERLMGYPVTVGLAAAGLVIAQRVRKERKVRKAMRMQAAGR